MQRQGSVLLCLIGVIGFSNGVKIEVENTKVEAIDPEYLKVDINIRKEDGHSVVDINADVLQDMITNLFFQLHLQKKRGDQYDSLYQSDVVDRCHFVDNMPKYPILKDFFEEISHYGNMFDSCPVKKGAYHIKGFKLSPKGELINLLQPGEYLLHTIYMLELNTNMKTLYSVIFQFKVE